MLPPVGGFAVCPTPGCGAGLATGASVAQTRTVRLWAMLPFVAFE